MVQPDYSLESRIAYEMKGFSGEYSVYASDFESEINHLSSELWETASCIKVFILASLAKACEEKIVKKTELIKYHFRNYVAGSGVLRALNCGLRLTIEDISTLMIIVSDNIATNMIIERLGVDYINKSIQDLGFVHTKLLHEIDFDHYDDLGVTTAREYGELFKRIYTGTLISKQWSMWMLDILEKQQYQTLLTDSISPYLLDSENTGDEPLLKVYSKSGALDDCRNDGGIVETKLGTYVVVVFTRQFKDKLYHRNHESFLHGSRLSNLILNHYMSTRRIK